MITTRCLAPGVYSVGPELHLAVHELLDAAGYADTPDNVETVVKAALDVFGDLDIPITFSP